MRWTAVLEMWIIDDAAPIARFEHVTCAVAFVVTDISRV